MQRSTVLIVWGVSRVESAWRRVRDVALALPGAALDEPWEGDLVVKVGGTGKGAGKVFVFLGSESAERPHIGVKLADSHEEALAVPGAQPSSYGLGRSGWVSVPIAPLLEEPDGIAVLCDWVRESYGRVAP
jgi:predicted DNA-binding protein (MmcQ/YjbR family)